MTNEKLFKHIHTIRIEAKRRVRAFAAKSGNRRLMSEVEMCLETNEAKLLSGLDEESYELLVMHEEMYAALQRIAKLSR